MLNPDYRDMLSMLSEEGVEFLPVIGRAHLIQNKRASGRPKDLADLTWLEDASPR
jgi:hypothetical protein